MKRADPIFPLRGKTTAKRSVGGKSGGHGFTTSRGNRRVSGKGRGASGPRPDVSLCKYRFDEDERSA